VSKGLPKDIARQTFWHPNHHKKLCHSMAGIRVDFFRALTLGLQGGFDFVTGNGYNEKSRLGWKKHF